MSLNTSTLRPGFLVSMKTSVRGNVSYLKHELPVIDDEPVEGSVARWETTRTITDPVEHTAAKKARSKAATLIRSVCKQSAFGLLCPEDAAPKLEKALADARKVVDDFNDGAKLSRVGIYILTGRVMPDDVEAVRAINSEIRELMAEMATGIEGKNVDAIREAASRVKGIGDMLSVEAQAKVTVAVETARAAAKQLVKEGPAAAVDQSAINKIGALRAAFLDLDDSEDVAAPKAGARASLDLAGAE